MEFGGKLIIQMIRKLVLTFLVVLLIVPTLSQFGTTLTPVNRCLDSCDTCANDELSKCKSCIQGFSGPKCALDSSYIKENMLMDQKEGFGSSPYQWDNTSMTRCSYENSKGDNVDIKVLGLYTSLSENSVTVDVFGHYQIAVVYFNMIRSSWAPFSDLLRVGFQADKVIMGEYFIEYQRRDQINPNTNKITCGGLLRINDRFKMIVNIPRAKMPKKLRIHFEGMVFSGSVWGLTNVRVVFGCDNFLTLNTTSKTCSICSDGFYSNEESSVVGCQRCPSECTTCRSEQNCLSCLSGFDLVNGSCQPQNNKMMEYYDVSGFKSLCGYFVSEFNGTTVLSAYINDIKPHEPEITIFADIAHIPEEWTPSEQIEVWVNEKNIVNISTVDFSDTQEPKKHCPEFDPIYGFYAVGEIKINNIQSSANNIHIEFKSDRNVTLGISHVAIQYEPKKQTQPEPTPQPIPEQNAGETNSNVTQDSESNATEKSNTTQPMNESNLSEDDFSMGPREMVIQELKENSEKLSFELQTADFLLVKMRHEFLDADKSFPYLGFKIEEKEYKSLTVDSGEDYQLVKIAIQESFVNKNITVFARNQQYRPPNQDIILVEQGLNLLKNSQPFMEQKIGTIHVNRYDHLQDIEWGTINGCGIFFQVIAWSTILITICLSCLGNSVITQQFSLMLQVIFLHVYIYTAYLPVTFKYALAGLTRMQDLNYFFPSHQDKIENFLLPGVIQDSDIKFFAMGHKDTNFTRSVYPTLIIALGYFVFFVVLNLIRKKIEPNLEISEEEQSRTLKERISLFIIRVSERVLNFWYQIWQYQFIVVVWAACTQFYNFEYPEGKTNIQVPNFMFCFAWFILILVLPSLTMAYLNKKYFRLDYFEYCYWYENIFFLKLPDESLPSNHHRVLIVIRNVRYLLIVICIAALSSFPITALLLMCFVNVGSLIYYQVTHVEIEKFLSRLNFIEHLLLIVLAVLMMVCYGINQYAESYSYLTLGKVMISVVFLLVFQGIFRVGYLSYKKSNTKEQKAELSEFKPAIATQRVV